MPEVFDVDTDSLPAPIWDFCGGRITDEGHQCPALDDGRCAPRREVLVSEGNWATVYHQPLGASNFPQCGRNVQQDVGFKRVPRPRDAPR